METSITNEKHEIAQRALKEMRQELPSLRAFARAISRNPKMDVELVSSGPPRTDGSTLFLPVLMELGKKMSHVRSLCGERDEDRVLLCEACKRREELFVWLFHETGHCIHGTFKLPDVGRVESAIREGFSTNLKRMTAIESRFDKLEATYSSLGRDVDAMSLSHCVSPFFPTLLNALEDVRVNGEVIKVRKGTRKMFAAHAAKALRDGREGLTEENSHWRDAPRDAQAAIGLMLKATYDEGLLKYLSEDVAEAVGNDEELGHLAEEALNSPNVTTTFEIALRSLIRFKELGFMLDSDDEPEEEPPVGDPGESEDSTEGESDDKSEEPDDEAEGDAEADTEGDAEESDEESDDEAGDGTGKPEDDEPEGSDNSDESGSPGESDDSSDDSGESGGDDDSAGSDDSGDSKEESGSGGSGDSGASDSGGFGEASASSGMSDEEAEAAAEAMREALKDFTGHGDDKYSEIEEDRAEGQDSADEDDKSNSSDEAEAVENAMRNGGLFDEPSSRITDVRVSPRPEADSEAAVDESRVWSTSEMLAPATVDKRVLTASVLQAKRTFTENRKGKLKGDLRNGPALDGRKLGYRIPTEDPRIFMKRVSPGRRSYFVLIGLDVSGSTARPGESGQALVTEMKSMVATHAALLDKLRIPFAVYAHSGFYEGDFRIKRGTVHGNPDTSRSTLDIGIIKAPNEPWSSRTKESLDRVNSYAWNLDGHTLEYYRKVIEQRHESDRLILYYTDGAMPYENFEEEKAILIREIATLNRLGVHLLGVGCGTDSPKQYGLETVCYDEPSDTRKVLEALRVKLQ